VCDFCAGRETKPLGKSNAGAKNQAVIDELMLIGAFWSVENLGGS
jgi:hypothetical protein